VKDLHRQPGTLLNRTLSRRGAIAGLGATGLAAALTVPAHGIAAARQSDVEAGQIEPNAGSWKTWLLKSGDQLDPGAPPDAGATRAELAGLRGIVATADAESMDRINFWDAGAPGFRWNELVMQLTRAAGQGPGDAYRAMALLNVAIYDATIATWKAKYTYHRPRPVAVDASLTTYIPTPVFRRRRVRLTRPNTPRLPARPGPCSRISSLTQERSWPAWRARRCGLGPPRAWSFRAMALPA
jgi:hypothetical protein